MARAGLLTALTVQKLKPPKSKTARVERRDAAVPGLGVRITAQGARSWIFVFTSPTRHKRVRYTIGIVDFKNPDGKTTLNLEQARAKAIELRAIVRDGRDPADEREGEKMEAAAAAAEADQQTFRAVAELYMKRELPTKRRGWETEQIINRELMPIWGHRPLGSITAIDIEKRVETLVDAGKPEAARRVFEIIRRLFNWALAKPSLGLERSPADRMKPAQLVGKKKKRKRTLNNDELRALWRAADRAGYPFGPMTQMLMLTALRLREVAEARWDEINLAERQWIIPRERMKGDNAHLVPLTAEMIEIIGALPRLSDFLFSANRGEGSVTGFSAAKRRLDKLMLEELRGIAATRGDDPAKVELDPWVFHDLRRTARTHLSALPVAAIVRELILAHAKSDLDQSYDQYEYIDEKMDALQKWALRLGKIVEPPPADNVVALRG